VAQLAGDSARRVDALVLDAGPGRPGHILRAALAGPHIVIGPGSAPLVLPNDSVIRTTIIVLERDATVASVVHGDVIVVGGDLFLRPGARIDGRAIAMGGAVYSSSLAYANGGQLSFRDVTFDAREQSAGRFALDYRTLELLPQRFAVLPFPVGLRPPGYTRIDGLALSWGPVLSIDTGVVTLEPTVTYRSHLGVFDPAVVATLQPERRTAINLDLRRGTFTNDAWIRGDVVNALTTFFGGSDVRNYYRADRGEITARHRYETESLEIEPFVGALAERAWSVARDTSSQHVPYSVIGRDDIEGMRRANPRIADGSIASAIGGLLARWESHELVATGQLRVELPWHAPDDARFVQTTVNGEVGFPTFGTQRFDAAVHGVLTAGDRAPAQRFAYLGGSGTLPTLFLLSEGGDQLLFVESSYSVPIDRLALPLVGPPTISLRHLLGSAGVDRLPRLTQNVGVRLSVSLVRADFLVDPDTHKHRVMLGVGFGH
jgi:hypothetical protein